MLAGQTLRNRDGLEVCLFPMTTMTITCGVDESYHKGTNNIDIAGKDIGAEPLYAPVSLVVVQIGNLAEHAVVFESQNPVLLADGTVDHITIWCVHDNNVSDLRVGMLIPQGQKMYDEGSSGFATGNHVHMGVAKGKFKGIELSAIGYNKLVGDVHPTLVFHSNNTIMAHPVYHWKEWKEMNLTQSKFPTAKTALVDVRFRKAPTLVGAPLGLLAANVAYPYLGVTDMIEGYQWAKLLIGDSVVWSAHKFLVIDEPAAQVVVQEVIKEVIKTVESAIDETVTLNNGIELTIRRVAVGV